MLCSWRAAAPPVAYPPGGGGGGTDLTLYSPGDGRRVKYTHWSRRRCEGVCNISKCWDTGG